MAIRHAFVSPVADASNPDEVGPDEWNDDHDFDLADASTIKPVSIASKAGTVNSTLAAADHVHGDSPAGLIYAFQNFI